MPDMVWVVITRKGITGTQTITDMVGVVIRRQDITGCTFAAQLLVSIFSCGEEPL